MAEEITIRARAQYQAQQSDPEAGRFVFAYTIQIRNIGKRRLQLLRRHWVITDASDAVEEVRGDGVVGQQPWLDPGEAFEYQSGAVLPTAYGAMHGEYEFSTAQGEIVMVDIPPFVLSTPRTLH